MYEEGDRVKWKWGDGWAEGTVQSRFEKTVERKIDGNQVTRHGSQDNPAYYIVQEDGNNVLKLGSEIEKA